MIVNGAFAFPINATLLRQFRALHDIAIVVFPLLLLWNCGLSSHGLLTGGTFSGQTWVWQTILIVSLSGAIPFFLGVLRWQWVRRFEFHNVAMSEVFDVAAIARQGTTVRDVRGSRWHPVTVWPWNEILTLEVNVKRIQTSSHLALTRRPLRIVHFSDLHFIDCPGADFYRFMVGKTLEFNADAIVFTGDLIDEPELLATVVEILIRLRKLLHASSFWGITTGVMTMSIFAQPLRRPAGNVSQGRTNRLNSPTAMYCSQVRNCRGSELLLHPSNTPALTCGSC